MPEWRDHPPLAPRIFYLDIRSDEADASRRSDDAPETASARAGRKAAKPGVFSETAFVECTRDRTQEKVSCPREGQTTERCVPPLTAICFHLCLCVSKYAKAFINAASPVAEKGQNERRVPICTYICMPPSTHRHPFACAYV